MKPAAFATSVVANVALLAALAFRPSLAPPAVREVSQRYSPFAPAPAAPALAVARPTDSAQSYTLPRHQFWQRLATDDLRALITRLREAGFPPDVIRQVVESEVSTRYNRRLLALDSFDPAIPTWQQRSRPLADPKRLEAYTVLQYERSRLLRELLTDPQLPASPPPLRPVWGARLTDRQIDRVQQIEQDYQEMAATVRAAMRDGIQLPEDREKLVLLQREKHADLAAILSSEEFADYALRTSPITADLGVKFGNFVPTDSEFRAIHQAYATLSEKYPAGFQGLGPVDRQTVGAQAAELLQAALGPSRYAEYQRETSSDFQRLDRQARQANLPPSAAHRVFNLRDSTEREANRIIDDPALSLDAKRNAFKELAQTARSEIMTTLGPTVGPAYQRSSGNWLTALESGMIRPVSKTPLIIVATVTGTTMIGGPSPEARRLPDAPSR